MTRKACLIFNPVAGQTDPDQDLEIIKAILASEREAYGEVRGIA